MAISLPLLSGGGLNSFEFNGHACQKFKSGQQSCGHGGPFGGRIFGVDAGQPASVGKLRWVLLRLETAFAPYAGDKSKISWGDFGKSPFGGRHATGSASVPRRGDFDLRADLARVGRDRSNRGGALRPNHMLVVGLGTPSNSGQITPTSIPTMCMCGTLISL